MFETVIALLCPKKPLFFSWRNMPHGISLNVFMKQIKQPFEFITHIFSMQKLATLLYEAVDEGLIRSEVVTNILGVAPPP